MKTSAQVVETFTSNSPSQDYTHPDDHNLPNYDMTPGFKPFTENYNAFQTIFSFFLHFADFMQDMLFFFTFRGCEKSKPNFC